jgi:hypothetical protein
MCRRIIVLIVAGTLRMPFPHTKSAAYIALLYVFTTKESSSCFNLKKDLLGFDRLVS